MKGVIATCLAGLVRDTFGRDKWEDALEDAGMDRHAVFSAIDKIDDDTVLKIVASLCKVLNITSLQVADAFGDYWINVYAPRIYESYLQEATCSKELLLGMDKVHEAVTSTIPNASPPRFEYEWKNSRTLIMKYRSDRGLIDFSVGLIKGVGRYFKEDLRVRKLNNKDIEVVFEKK
jgi:hypothetical protein